MCFVLLLRRVRREHKMLLCRSSLTKLCPKIGIIYLRFGSSKSTICPHFVPSADPATQFVPILCSRRTPRRTFLSFFHFVFCVHNCVGGPGSSDIGCLVKFKSCSLLQKAEVVEEEIRVFRFGHRFESNEEPRRSKVESRKILQSDREEVGEEEGLRQVVVRPPLQVQLLQRGLR